MEKLQSKLDSYERKLLSPEYIEMNKKENEILILRAENSNLKNSIAATEQALHNLTQKFSDYKAEKEKILFSNQELICKLTKKLNDINSSQIKKLEESSLIESSTNSLSEKNDNSKNSTNFSKSRMNYNSDKRKSKNKGIVALTSRMNSNNDSNNLFALFNSETKGQKSDRKVSINDQFHKENEILNSLVSKVDSSNESKKTPKTKDFKHPAYSNIFEKLGEKLRAQQINKDKMKESKSIDKIVVIFIIFFKNIFC